MLKKFNLKSNLTCLTYIQVQGATAPKEVQHSTFTFHIKHHQQNLSE